MTFLLVDILPLKSDKTVDEAVAYFEKVRPAMERNGLNRLDSPLETIKNLRGNVVSQMINLFETADPEASMKGMSQDPDYQANIAERDAIFDLDNASIILTKKR